MQPSIPADQYADVLVIGGGIAGLIAATRCALEGLKVIVAEKSAEDRYICNSRLTGGIFHLAYHSVFDDESRIVADIEAATEQSNDPHLIQTVASDAKRVVRWLESVGIRFLRGSSAGWHSHVLAPPALPQLGRPWQGRGGDVVLRTLAAHLSKLNGELLRGHRAERLILKSGRVGGAEGSRTDGSRFAIGARAVVIADGGFQANRDKVARHISPAFDRIVQRNSGTGGGDGLHMALAAGADSTPLEPFYGHLLSRDALTNDLLWPYPYLDEIARVAVVVGQDGRRFVDEGLGGISIANALVRLADPACALIILDQAIWNGPGRQRALPPNPILPKAGATIHTATTLPGLADLSGLPEAALTDEIDRYNAALRNSAPGQLKPGRSVHKYQPLPIIDAPFHAIPVAPGITYTMGGIRIDPDARALTPSGQPLPGLYAAGSATGGIEGGPTAGYVGGLSIAGVTGLRAAEHICADFKAHP